MSHNKNGEGAHQVKQEADRRFKCSIVVVVSTNHVYDVTAEMASVTSETCPLHGNPLARWKSGFVFWSKRACVCEQSTHLWKIRQANDAIDQRHDMIETLL